MSLAHEHCGHYSYRKTTKVSEDILLAFHGEDIRRYCRTCENSQRRNKSGPSRAPMVCREIVCEPYERVCVDLVGPLPKARGGHQYLLTHICVATHWPKAIPLRSMETRPVVDALVEIFSRCSIPRVLITDNGTQFTNPGLTSSCTHSLYQ